MPHNLPAELIDAFVNTLPDSKAIKRSSLICRAWVPWTRRRLFSFVGLHDGNNFPRFLRLLRSPHCTFLPHVRRLHIWWWPDLFETHRHECKTFLDWLDSDDKLSHKVKRVVNFFDRGPFNLIPHLVRLFPTLEHLEFPLDLFQHSERRLCALSPISPPLKSLAIVLIKPPPCDDSELWARKWRHFMEWIHRQGIYGISRVYLKELEAVTIEGVEAFLKSQGTALKHLHIGPTTYSSAFHHVSASRMDFNCEILQRRLNGLHVSTLATIPTSNHSITRSARQ
jgi:hypothetical protein